MAGTVTPALSGERTHNTLRPERLRDVIGQDSAKLLMARAINACFDRKLPLDHVLLVGPSGTGKSTFSHVIGNELGARVFDIEAPISFDTLMELRTTMLDGEILKIEEIHQQAIMERRGRQAATRPEVLYAVMEDRVLPTQTGLLEFPHITIIGTTTDEGMLPDAFVNRFALRPRLERYGLEQMREIVRMNLEKLELQSSDTAVKTIARAARSTPREANNLAKNAAILAGPEAFVSDYVAEEVLQMNGLTEDGLTADMQAMLTFLYTRGRRESKGEVRYQASVNTIATGIGKSRDSKAVSLRVEPFLIEQGYLQVLHGGRCLTDAGVARAKGLV